MESITFVTGAWDIGRDKLDNTNSNHDWKRSFETYLLRLKELLNTGLHIVVFGDSNIQSFVEEYENCRFILFTNADLQNFEYFDRIDKIRTSPEWYDQPSAQWLKSSPQATLPLYVTITLNKLIFIKKTSEINPFQSDRFYWIDAGITKTHAPNLIQEMSPKLLKYNKFLFLSLYYASNTEIHGFLREGVHKHCNVDFVDKIVKGFFFGGNIDKIDEILELYRNIIDKTLDEKHLGTEETYFTIMKYQRPDLFEIANIEHCFDTMQFL